jgi:hypothetical protein
MRASPQPSRKCVTARGQPRFKYFQLAKRKHEFNSVIDIIPFPHISCRMPNIGFRRALNHPLGRDLRATMWGVEGLEVGLRDPTRHSQEKNVRKIIALCKYTPFLDLIGRARITVSSGQCTKLQERCSPDLNA